MRTYKVIMVLSNKTEVTISRGLGRQMAMQECARLNQERAIQTARKIHYIVR